MATYQITSAAGVDLGAYSGASPEQAIDAMHRDAGYLGTEGAADALGTTVEALRAELAATALRGRPPKAAADKRDVLIRAHATTAEDAELRAAAEAAGVPLSEYVRESALRRARGAAGEVTSEG